MTLVAGSYEKFLWGFKLKTIEKPSLKLLFSYPSHNSAIKSVAISGTVAVSGGDDDTVKIYDLSSSSEIGSLTDHSDSVTSLSFYTPPNLSFPRNLISGSDDGTVCIYDADPFVHLKSIHVHRKGINDVSIHHSGKLALSVGKDSCLAMLNLVRGRRSFYCRLDGEASIVKFNVDGEKFFTAMDEKISMHESEDAKMVFEMKNQKRVLCVVPSESSLLFTGGEDRHITVWDTLSGKIAYSIEDSHATRVKGLVVFGRGNMDEANELPYLVASASSDGMIRLWDMRHARKERPNPLAETNTKSRITCFAGTSLKSAKKPQIQGDAMNED